jgi:hypothetical protein
MHQKSHSLRAQPRACPERSRRGSAVLQTRPGNVFRQSTDAGSGESVARLRRSDNVGESMSQPCRAGLTFGGRPYGPQSPDRFLEKHFQEGPAELQIPRLRSPWFPVEVGGFLAKATNRSVGTCGSSFTLRSSCSIKKRLHINPYCDTNAATRSRRSWLACPRVLQPGQAASRPLGACLST